MARTKAGQPPTQVRSNRAGAISMMAWTHHLGIPDGAVFDVTEERDGNTIKIVLTYTPAQI